MCAVQNMKDEMEKQELMRRVEEKNEKTQAIEEQRLALQAELSATLREIAASDAWLRVCHLAFPSHVAFCLRETRGIHDEMHWRKLLPATPGSG